MALILRVDVDKPYGRATLLEKVLSKIREDYWFPALHLLGYLNDFKIFINFLAEEKIAAHIYFRKCTLPKIKRIKKYELDKHSIGVHIENTRNYNTFKHEIDEISNYLLPVPINSFTKHGSGNLKLGRYHYPPYEPEKYIKWARFSSIPFLFGNGDIFVDRPNGFYQTKHYPCAFWIDRLVDHGQLQFNSILDLSKKKNVVIIIHPANFVADRNVENNLRNLIILAKKHHVKWITT